MKASCGVLGAFVSKIKAIMLLGDHLGNTDLKLFLPFEEIPAMSKASCSVLGAFLSKIKAIVLPGGHLSNIDLRLFSPF